MNQEEIIVLHEYLRISKDRESHAHILENMDLSDEAFDEAFEALTVELVCLACGNSGWLHAVGETGGNQIERCDSCEMVSTDAAAIIFHKRMCGCSWTDQKAKDVKDVNAI